MPVVFVTQGTLANTNFDQLINPTLAALAEESLQVVVTAGGGDMNLIRKPANAIVAPYVPYEAIFPKASIFVTNGGYNGVQQALSFGVPSSLRERPKISHMSPRGLLGVELVST